jgi:hypothetical protein
MATCLWKHESVPVKQVREIYQSLPGVIMTSGGCWSSSDKYVVPIRELEDQIGWDAYSCGPLFEWLPVTEVIWQEDNGDIVLYESLEGFTDGDLKELRKFSSIQEAESFVKEQAVF